MERKTHEGNQTSVDWKPPQGRRWTDEDARAGLAAARASGESISKFARSHGVDGSRFYWWMKHLRKSATKPLAILPVQVVDKRAATDGGKPDRMVEVVLAGGKVVRVGRGFDAGVLRAVIAALEAGPC